MKYRLILALLTIGLCSNAVAQDKAEYPRISFVGPGASKNPITRDQFILLVVEGPYISYEKNPIPSKGVVEYVNNLLKTKGVTYLGIYTREGAKYGDVVRAIDTLRKTNARDIGVSMVEVPVGREP